MQLAFITIKDLILIINSVLSVWPCSFQNRIQNFLFTWFNRVRLIKSVARQLILVPFALQQTSIYYLPEQARSSSYASRKIISYPNELGKNKEVYQFSIPILPKNTSSVNN